MCNHCDAIRFQAAMIMQLTFAGQTTGNVLQTIAAIHAALRRDAVEVGKEVEFAELWVDMMQKEFEYINEINPQEPSEFDPKFDFRKHI